MADPVSGDVTLPSPEQRDQAETLAWLASLRDRRDCPVCGREYMVRKDGRLRAHKTAANLLRVLGYQCNGSGSKPEASYER